MIRIVREKFIDCLLTLVLFLVYIFRSLPFKSVAPLPSPKRGASLRRFIILNNGFCFVAAEGAPRLFQFRINYIARQIQMRPRMRGADSSRLADRRTDG